MSDIRYSYCCGYRTEEKDGKHFCKSCGKECSKTRGYNLNEDILEKLDRIIYLLEYQLGLIGKV